MIKLAIGLVLSVSLWMTNPVFAAPANSRAIILVVEGTDAEAAREIASSGVLGATPEGSEDLLAAVEDQGVTGSVGQALVNPRTRRATILAVRRGMKRAGANGVLLVHARPSKAGAKSIHVVLLVSTQSEPMIEEDIAVPKGEKAAPRVVSRLSTLVGAPSLPPAAAEPGGSTTPTRAAAPSTPAAPPSTPAAPSSAAAAPATPAPAPPAAAPATAVDPPTRPELPAASAVQDGPKQNEEPVEAAEKDATATKRRPLDHTNSMVFAEVAVGVARRSMNYIEPLYGPLRPYRAPAVAVYSIGAEIYPAASSGINVAKDIGLAFRVANSLSLESKSADGTQTARALFWRYAVGLRGRILAGKAKNSPLIGLEGTYGVWSFLFGGDTELVEELPPVQYRYLRAGADVRVPVGVFSLLGGAGYMNVLSAGPLTDRFPNARIFGLDATIGGTYPVLPWVDVRLALTYARIFSNAHADVEADYVAGGALDQYFIGNLGMSAIF